MGEQCYEVDEKEIAPQDYRERARAVSGKRCDRSEARSTANHARTSLDATVHAPSTTLLSTVERMETEVGLPLDEPKSHFLDVKGNLFRAKFITTACATQLLSQAGLGMVMIHSKHRIRPSRCPSARGLLVRLSYWIHIRSTSYGWMDLSVHVESFFI